MFTLAFPSASSSANGCIHMDLLPHGSPAPEHRAKAGKKYWCEIVQVENACTSPVGKMLICLKDFFNFLKNSLGWFIGRSWRCLCCPSCMGFADLLSVRAEPLQQVAMELSGDCFKMRKAEPNPAPGSIRGKIPVVFNRLWISSENAVRVVYTHVHLVFLHNGPSTKPPGRCWLRAVLLRSLQLEWWCFVRKMKRVKSSRLCSTCTVFSLFFRSL